MPDILMQCGHRANAVNEKKEPCCAICIGMDPKAELVALEEVALDGRKAVCSYCSREESSSLSLPFFAYQPQVANDAYYCGCRGWD